MSLRQTVQVGPPLRYAGGHCNAAKETWKAVRPAGFTGHVPLKVAVDSTPSARLPAISIVALPTSVKFFSLPRSRWLNSQLFSFARLRHLVFCARDSTLSGPLCIEIVEAGTEQTVLLFFTLLSGLISPLVALLVYVYTPRE